MAHEQQIGSGFLTQARHSDAPDFALQVTADLPGLCGPQMKSTAALLRQVLDRIGFDALNRLVRGVSGTDDYDKEPFPRGHRFRKARQLLDHMRKGKAAGSGEARLAQTMAFFMFGESLSRPDLLGLLDAAPPESFQALADMAIIVPLAGDLWRTNDLSLFSQRLDNSRVIYGLADTPSHYPSCRAAERVYIGPDSYLLSAQVQSSADTCTGPVAEVGSGSGYQLLVAATAFPEADLLCGLEIDSRAIRIARFNAALNGLSERIHITDDAARFAGTFKERRAALGLLNPPFMPVPEAIPMDVDDRRALGDLAVPAPDSGPGHVALRPLFAKSGWGGIRGLQITDDMLKTLLGTLGRDGRAIVHSTFSMSPGGRLDACDLSCLTDTGWAPEALFEAGATDPSSPSAVSCRRPLSLRQVATEIGIILTQCPPASSRINIDIAERMIDRIAAAYTHAGIHGFVSGNLVLAPCRSQGR